MSDMTEKKTRAKRRGKEELIAELRKKIDYHQKAIDTLNDRIKELETPKVSATKQINELLKKAKSQGLTPEQIAEKLGIDL